MRENNNDQDSRGLLIRLELGGGGGPQVKRNGPIGLLVKNMRHRSSFLSTGVGTGKLVVRIRKCKKIRTVREL